MAIVKPKNKPPKYKIGDTVYSYHTRAEPALIKKVYKAKEYGEPHRYDIKSKSHSAKNQAEGSLSKTKFFLI